jgi:signal transduction histidine kinase
VSDASRPGSRTALVVVGALLLELAFGVQWDLLADDPPTGGLAAVLAAAVVGVAVLAWRRRAPVVVLALVALHAVAATFAFGVRYSPLVPGLVATFALAAHRDRRTAVAAAILAVPPVVAYSLVTIDFFEYSGPAAVAVFLLVAVVYAVAWTLGDRFRQHRLEVDDLDARRRVAVAEERSRLARELHDVVSHAVSVMVLQAAGARTLLARDPDQAAAALSNIETSGREAMNELRRMLGVLRAAGGEDTDPGLDVHGLDEAAHIVERIRAAGAHVDLVVEGAPGRLDPSVDHTAYRLVQEALTNALRHGGGADAVVDVRLDWRGDLTVEVTNHHADVDDAEVGAGGRGGAVDVEGTGAGLLGLHERIAMVGGTFEAGHGHQGAFRVRAVLPVARAGATDPPGGELVT